MLPQYPNSIAHGGEGPPRVSSYASGCRHTATRRPGFSRRREFARQIDRIVCHRGTSIAARKKTSTTSSPVPTISIRHSPSIRLFRLYILAKAFGRVENRPDKRGLTALNCAYLKGDRESIRNLLRGRASSSFEDKLGYYEMPTSRLASSESSKQSVCTLLLCLPVKPRPWTRRISTTPDPRSSPPHSLDWNRSCSRLLACCEGDREWGGIESQHPQCTILQ